MKKTDLEIAFTRPNYKWLIACPKCQRESCPNFDALTCDGDPKYTCPHCNQTISADEFGIAAKTGRWIAI